MHLRQALVNTLWPRLGWGLEEAQGSLEQPCWQTLGLTLEKLPGVAQLSDQLVAFQVHSSSSSSFPHDYLREQEHPISYAIPIQQPCVTTNICWSYVTLTSGARL